VVKGARRSYSWSCTEMPIPLRLSLATLVLAALLLARPPTATAEAEPRTAAAAAVHSSASASLVSPYRPLGDGTTLSTTHMVGLIVACFVPALVLVLRERSSERVRAERPR
jgi:hypothetical protein